MPLYNIFDMLRYSYECPYVILQYIATKTWFLNARQLRQSSSSF